MQMTESEAIHLIWSTTHVLFHHYTMAPGKFIVFCSRHVCEGAVVNGGNRGVNHQFLQNLLHP